MFEPLKAERNGEVEEKALLRRSTLGSEFDETSGSRITSDSEENREMYK